MSQKIIENSKSILEILKLKCFKRKDLLIISGLVSALLIFGMWFYKTVSIENVHFKVFDFFEAIESDNIRELKSIFTGSDAQEIQNISESFASMTIEEEYGIEFCEKMNEFKKYFFRKVYSEIEITHTEYYDGKYYVTVIGKSKSDFVYDNSYLESLMNTYEESHRSELAKISKLEGKNKMIQKIYTDLADTILSDMKKKLNEWEVSEFISVFTIEENHGDLTITNIRTSSK